MCGGRKLTHTAYANQRMTLARKLRQSIKSKRNTMIALRGQSTWRVFIIHVLTRAFGDAFYKTWMSWDTPLFFSAQGSVVLGSAEKEAESDSIAGARYLNDTPSGCG